MIFQPEVFWIHRDLLLLHPKNQSPFPEDVTPLEIQQHMETNKPQTQRQPKTSSGKTHPKKLENTHKIL